MAVVKLLVPYRSQWEDEGLKDPNARRTDCFEALAAGLIEATTGKRYPIAMLDMQTSLQYNDNGTSLAGGQVLLAKYGVNSTIQYVVTPKFIENQIILGVPFVGLGMYGAIKNRQDIKDVHGLHFILVRGFDDTYFYVNDPDFWGDRVAEGDGLAIPKADYMNFLAWSGYSGKGLVVSLKLKVAPETPLAAIIDLSHWDKDVSYPDVKADGISTVIYKTGEGLGNTDPTFPLERSKILDAGLDLSTYYYLTGANASLQANHCLKVTSKDLGRRIWMDFETNQNGPNATIAVAEEFATIIQKETGRLPGIYGGWWLRWLLRFNQPTLLSSCDLWIGWYLQSQPLIPRQHSGKLMWQYTDGIYGYQPRLTARKVMDRSYFMGDQAAISKYFRSL